jgi:hypothetical protein
MDGEAEGFLDQLAQGRRGQGGIACLLLQDKVDDLAGQLVGLPWSVGLRDQAR